MEGCCDGSEGFCVLGGGVRSDFPVNGAAKMRPRSPWTKWRVESKERGDWGGAMRGPSGHLNFLHTQLSRSKKGTRGHRRPSMNEDSFFLQGTRVNESSRCLWVIFLRRVRCFHSLRFLARAVHSSKSVGIVIAALKIGHKGRSTDFSRRPLSKVWLGFWEKFNLAL